MSLSEAQIQQRRNAARRGGAALIAKYGHEHMRMIGARGGRAFWQRYYLIPIQGNDFAIVDRETGQTTRTMNGYHLPPRQQEVTDDIGF